VGFRGGYRTSLVDWAPLALVGLASACTSNGIASRDGGAGGFGGLAFDAGGDGIGTIIGDPDRSHDAAGQAGGGQGGSTGGAGAATGGAPGAGGALGAGGVGGAGHSATIPIAINPCRLLGIGYVISMDVSPDGALVAYGSIEGGVTLIGVVDFVARRTITAHAANVTAVAFSPDSTRIASADAAGNVALWNVADGSPIWSAAPLDGSVEGLALSSSGTVWALTANGLYAIDGASGSHAAASPGTGAAALALSPDGQTIALGGTDGGVRLLAAPGLTPTTSIAAANPGGVTALRISGDGQKLVTGGADGTTALWDLAGNLLTRISQPGAPVTSVDVNADGSLLAASEDRTPSVRAFKPDGTVLADWDVFPFFTRLSVDGKYLISMSHGARVDRDPVDTTQTATAQVWQDFYTAAAFSPDGRYVAEAVFDDIRLWDTLTGEMVRLLDATPPILTPADGIAFSPDGSALARNDYNHNLWVLGTADSALLADDTGVTGGYSVAYSPDGQWLATTGPSTVMLWRASDGTSGPTGFVGSGGKAPTAVAFSPDGQMLAVGDGGGNVVLWSFPGGTLVAEFAAVPAAVQQIGFSPDGTRLAVGDAYDSPALFGPDGTKIAVWPRALSSSFTFSFDGDYLATIVEGSLVTEPNGVGTDEVDILLSSPATGAPAATYTSVANTSNQSFFLEGILAFAPHDHRLLVASDLGTVLCLP
jgi:WD40 repeat protein